MSFYNLFSFFLFMDVISLNWTLISNSILFLITDMTRWPKEIFGSGNGIPLAVAVVGLGLVFISLKNHRRTTNKFFSSLLTASRDRLSKIDTGTGNNFYLSRGPMFFGVRAESTPFYDLALRDSYKALAVIGANRSGKTIFISNYILYGMFPTVFDGKSDTPHYQ
jgi:hypothetical protein